MNTEVGPVETIAAIATPPGRGGIGVVRLSGPLCPRIAIAMLGYCPAPRRAQLATFRDAGGQVVDQGIALYYPGPASFTGDDVLELQGHGGPQVMDNLMRAVCEQGARPARPGEFSERAFLNNKLDLAQAEAIADLIDASSHQAATAALRSLQGEFSKRVQALTEGLVHLRVYVEAAIDFADEEIDYLADGEVLQRLDKLLNQLQTLSDQASSGVVLREGLQVVIAGQPNVGKSSLLNRLAGRDSAIVTDIAGTTRDLLREQITLEGLPLHIIDTAGLRETDEAVEQEGVRRARAQIEQADVVLLVVDDRNDLGDEETRLLRDIASKTNAPQIIIALNKCDLSGNAPGQLEADHVDGVAAQLRMSATTGEGLPDLTKHLHGVAGYQSQDSGQFLARRRHLLALDQARQAMEQGRYQLYAHAAGELLAEELRLAQDALASITGEFTSEDLLGEIFSSFCIGK